MLLAAQSMAVGTVMVRWVSKYSDPIMATGWVGCFIFNPVFIMRKLRVYGFNSVHVASLSILATPCIISKNLSQ